MDIPFHEPANSMVCNCPGGAIALARLARSMGLASETRVLPNPFDSWYSPWVHRPITGIGLSRPGLASFLLPGGTRLSPQERSRGANEDVRA